MSKKLKPLTIFLSDDELVNFKSHFDEFLNMNCDDKIKEQQEEIKRLKIIEEKYKDSQLYIKDFKDEIERLKEENNYYFKKNNELSTLNASLREDRDKYKNIIKEVREYIEEKINTAEQQFVSIPNKLVDIEVLNKLLEILDKGE